MSTKQANSWKSQSERGSLWGIRLIIGVYRLLGERVCKVVLFPVLLYFYLTGRETRTHLHVFYRQLQQYIDNDCGNNNNTSVKARPFANVLNFGFGIIDRLSLWTGRFAIERIRTHHSEVLYDHAATGQGGLIFSSHLGNFELCRAAGRARFSAKMNVLVDISNAKKINQMMQAVNNDFLADIIPVSEIDIALAIRLKEKVDNGEFVIIAADRVNSAGTVEHSTRVPFLGQPAAFPIGPYVLAKVLDCPVFSLYCFRADDGKYEVFFHRLFDRVQFDRRNRNEAISQYATRYAEQLADYSQRYPTQWYNFYDFWK